MNKNQRANMIKKLFSGVLVFMLVVTMMPGQAAFAEVIKEGLGTSATENATGSKAESLANTTAAQEATVGGDSVNDTEESLSADHSASARDTQSGKVTQDFIDKEKLVSEAEGISAAALAAPLSPEPRAGGEEFKFEVTVGNNDTFAVPTSSYLNGSDPKAYNWNINWGDSASDSYTGSSSLSSAGIPHVYTTAGTYTITLSPGGSSDAWLGAFGFYSGTDEANTAANKAKVTKLVSPLTPLMTRTQAQIADQSLTAQPTYEWCMTFYGCTKLTMGDAFTFDGTAWQGITAANDSFAQSMFDSCAGAAFTISPNFNLPQNLVTVGDSFAASMFRDCSGEAFTVSSNFNLPQNLTTVGGSFVASMFRDCSGDAFTISPNFNLPQNLTKAGDFFAQSLFRGCSGANFTMGTVFTFPRNLSSVGAYFASQMFSGCAGNTFTMSAAFNLPQNLSSVGTYFASQMFSGCTGNAFTMGTNFNLPQNLSSVDTFFAYQMFYNCSGAVFKVNTGFKFPTLNEADLNKNYVFYRTFFGVTARQNRSAASIINSPSGKNPTTSYYPSTERETFTTAFSDQPSINASWGGNVQLPAITTVALDNALRNADYSTTLQATGSTPITWLVKAGTSLPEGLSLNADTGVISGKAQKVGDYSFTIVATNCAGIGVTERAFNFKVVNERFQFEVTVGNNDTFAVPTSSYLNGSAPKAYKWCISWGDNTSASYAGNSSFNSVGIPHAYAVAGTYTITLSPNGSTTDAWLGAFGFYSGTDEANTAANKEKITKLISPLEPLMTRTQAQIANQTLATQPVCEWYMTFYGCTNLTMGDAFTFDDAAWQNITTASNYFASSMFYGCSRASFAMSSAFTLPQAFTTVGDQFAYEMFSGCSGDAFTMGANFNLPQKLITVGEFFASRMFYGCSGEAFTMNTAFTLPQNLTTVGIFFARQLFSNCSGDGFQVNSVFKFPTLNQANLDKTQGFYEVFFGVTAVQTRTAASIINSPSGQNPLTDYYPNAGRETFSTSFEYAFKDRLDIHANWGGLPSCILTYDLNGGTEGTGPSQARIESEVAYDLDSSTISKHASVGGIDVAFVGWSATADSTLYSKDDTLDPDFIITSVTLSADSSVYAVWGYDTNKNGIADVNETKYTLTYDVNGGREANETETVVSGTHPLDTSFSPTHVPASDTKPIIFVGWSTSALAVLGKDASAPVLVHDVVITNANVQVYAVWADDKNNNGVPDYKDSTYRTVTEHYVDRTGNTLQANTSMSILEGYSYTGNTAPILTAEGYAYGGAVYSAPSASSPSHVTGGALPTLSSVMSDAEVWYVYGTDTNKDGIEDVQVTRQWVFISGGVYVRVPGATKDIQTFNIGDTFTLNQTDAPAPTIPSGFTYRGYLTDQDVLTTTPQTGTPAIPITVAEGNRTISYVYDADPYWVAYHIVDEHTNEISEITAPAAEVGRIWGDTYGPVVAPTGTTEGRIYNGWKEGLAGTLQKTPITGTVTNNMDIYLVYGADTNRDGKEDVEVTRHALGTDGTALTTKHDPLTKTVNLENSPYTESQAGVSEEGWTYIGWNTTGSTTVYASGNPDITLQADTNLDVYYLYEKISYTITEHYVDRFGKQITADTSRSVLHGETYAGVAPAVTAYLYIGSALSAPTQALPSLVNDKDIPAISSITQDTSVWYVYGEDRVTESGSLGADGIEDLEVVRRWTDPQGNDITPSLPQATSSFNVGSAFAIDYSAGVDIPDSWSYVGYKLNGETLNRQTLPLMRSDPSFPIELATPLVKTVEYVFARSLCPITVTHVDTQGNSIGSQDETVTVSYGDNFAQDAVNIDGYTYAYWVLDGVSQDTSQISLTNITSAHTIQLVYKVDANPTPTPLATGGGLLQTGDPITALPWMLFGAAGAFLAGAALRRRLKVRKTQR